MRSLIVKEGLTFDDVLLVPQRSEVLPSAADTASRFSRRVQLNIPISSAAMDTVTDAVLAIALANEGGIGIIHRNLSIARQVQEVDKVKRSANGVILGPVTLPPEAPISRAKEIMETHNISGLPIVQGRRVVGILTRRDLRFQESLEARIEDVMTRDLVTAAPGTTLEEARAILHNNKVEKLVLVEEDGTLAGLITMKDLNHLEAFPRACRDSRGRLRVGAAVGVLEFDRCEALLEAGVDVLVVDTAHGHSANVLETVGQLKQSCDVDVVAGNVATAAATRDLIQAGADAVKVGIGPGSICTTRVVAGVGVPQLTAIMDAAEVGLAEDVPVIADGGIRHSGDIVKALAAGAESVMLGGLLAGLDESPGETVLLRGRTYKTVRGMGSIGAMEAGGKARYGQADVQDSRKLVPEGVEGLVPYKGRLSSFVYQLVGGVRSGLGYCGASNIAEFRAKATFVRVTSAALRESHPHDVHITKEAPNYFAED
ncbi:MAG: IMP dehydrogenase [Planctomycetota bacterium]